MKQIAGLALFVAAGLLSLSFPIGRSASVAAFTPTPQATAGPSAYVWPFQYTVSGPAVAHPEDRAIYHVTYRRNDSPAKEEASFRLGWVPPEAASFLSLATISGTEARGEQIDGVGGGWAIIIPAQQGAGSLEVTLRIAAEFQGILRVGIGVTGTDITMPEGSILAAYTVVNPPAEEPSLPGMGTGPERGWPTPKRGAVAGIMAFGAAVAVAGIWFVKRRWAP